MAGPYLGRLAALHYWGITPHTRRSARRSLFRRVRRRRVQAARHAARGAGHPQRLQPADHHRADKAAPLPTRIEAASSCDRHTPRNFVRYEEDCEPESKLDSDEISEDENDYG